MRRWWQSYSRFSSMERKGLSALLVMLLLLLVALTILRHQEPAERIHTDPQLLAAYNKYKQEHPSSSLSPAYEEQYAPPAEAQLFPFDPNTLDSEGFVRLGLRPKTVHLLLNWRGKGKTFYRKEELRSLYTLKEEEYQRLEPYIRIAAAAREPGYPAYAKQPPLPASIDLNITDSATLVRLNGIGPTLAHKIIEKRNALGGFMRPEQLNEIYRFPDTTFAMLRERLVISPAGVRRLKLNGATLEELAAHPYIGEKVAKNIILYRQGLGRFGNIEQLRQVPLMNEEIYRKIAPYFTLD